MFGTPSYVTGFLLKGLMNFFFLIFFLVGFYVDAMELKRERSEELNKLKKPRLSLPVASLHIDLLAQIFSARAAQNDWHRCQEDDILVNDIVAMAENPNQDDEKKLYSLRRVFRSDLYHCLAKYVLDEKIVKKGQRVYNPNTFLESCSLQKEAWQNAECLLKAGADPHVAVQKHHNYSSSIWLYGAAAYAFQGNITALRLLLRYGASVDIKHHDENPLINALWETSAHRAEVINILLYYRANPLLRLWSYNRYLSRTTPFAVASHMHANYPYSRDLQKCYDLCKFGHVRRVHRLAHYLARCLSGQQIYLPIELYYLIAQYHYGNLALEDWKQIATLSAFDYLKKGLFKDKIEAASKAAVNKYSQECYS